MAQTKPRRSLIDKERSRALAAARTRAGGSDEVMLEAFGDAEDFEEFEATEWADDDDSDEVSEDDHAPAAPPSSGALSVGIGRAAPVDDAGDVVEVHDPHIGHAIYGRDDGFVMDHYEDPADGNTAEVPRPGSRPRRRRRKASLATRTTMVVLVLVMAALVLVIFTMGLVATVTLLTG